LGVFLLAIFDSAGIPIPAALDALVVVTAALGPGKAYSTAAIATIGSVVGNMILFHVSRKGGEAYLARFTLHGRGARLRERFQEYGLITIFVPAVIPIPLPLKVFVICAGALGVKPLTFFVVISAARIPRYFGLAYLGAQVGENSAAWLKQHAWHMAAASAALFLVLFLAVRLTHHLRQRG
jgi:membrane protein YqaA with SNARE-associated domain